MSGKLIIAIITITLALVFYTIGVFGERVSRTLKKKHVVLFYLGLLCDATGTRLMTSIAMAGSEVMTGVVGNMHGIAGTLAILLMLFHAIWATVVVAKNKEKQKKNFHKFSLLVWIIWLIPYGLGVVIGMN